ncbi:hypothetical protein DIPPA_21873 [Diplonema papillatum]|nr:hypothetical protein DIPPA_24908 [Diplonema papillatum]KAJ9442107.1 hypothetical protein DIPPA_21873 [Diplonema papillatum]
MTLAQYWDGRAEVGLMGPEEAPRGPFKLLSGWDDDVSPLKFAAVREAVVDEGQRSLLPIVMYEALAVGLDETPAEYKKLVKLLSDLAMSSLLECAVVDGVGDLPASMAPRFKTAAKKWYRCREERREAQMARRDDERAARSRDLPARVLDAETQLALFGLRLLPRAVQKVLVTAALTGAFGDVPYPIVVGYPALLTDLACNFGPDLAREYDARTRRLFAGVRKGLPGTVTLGAACDRLLKLDTDVLGELQLTLVVASKGPVFSPTGRPQDVQGKYAFLERALGALPEVRDMPQVDKELREAIDSSALSPVLEAQRSRRVFLDRWRRRAGELVYCEGDACHVALLGEMLVELGIAEPDDLLANLRGGCPMSGPVGYESLYSPSLGDPELSVAELIRRQPDVLARVRRAVRGESDSNREAIWASVQKEVDRGFMVELAEPPTNSVFLRRFMVAQLKADQKGWQTKLRACDDGRMALVNKAVHMATKVKLDTVDVFVEVARQLAQQASGRFAGAAFYSVGLDHRDAYRQMKARNDVICRCVVAEGPDGLLRFFRLDRLSFGEAASVVHYNAFARVLARVVRRGLSLPLLQYYDDFACPCRLEDDLVLADTLELLGGILRTSFNDEKTSQGNSFQHLGLIFSIDGEGVHVSLSEPRKEKLVFVLEGVLARDSLAPGEAASLAGKLGQLQDFGTSNGISDIIMIMLKTFGRPGFGMHAKTSF